MFIWHFASTLISAKLELIGKHPRGVKALVSAELLLAAIAIPSGISMLSDPSGKIMDAQSILPYLTKALPFVKDFTLVGVFLAVLYGLLPIILSFGLWAQDKWAWRLSLLLGATQIVWIASEVVIFYDFGFFIFYPIIAGLGAVMIALCLWSSVRTFYSPKKRIPGNHVIVQQRS